MSSLKTYLPLLAKMLGVSADSLYERQRAAVSAGLLEAHPGRGPGSGVPATPRSVATLLLLMLATDGPSSVTPELRSLLDAKCTTGKRCKVTGKETLLDALTTCLESLESAKLLDSVHVDRTTRRSILFFKGPRKRSLLRPTEFGDDRTFPVLVVEARLSPQGHFPSIAIHLETMRQLKQKDPAS